jgi:hypothetical protein
MPLLTTSVGSPGQAKEAPTSPLRELNVDKVTLVQFQMKLQERQFVVPKEDITTYMGAVIRVSYRIIVLEIMLIIYVYLLLMKDL